MEKKSTLRQIVFPILAALIWGISFVAQDMCAGILDAFTINATRSFIAFFVLILIYKFFKAVRKKQNPDAEEEKPDRKMVLLGGLCCGAALAISVNLQQAGINAGTDAGKAAFITALYVVMVPVLGLFFKRKLSLSVWIAVILAVVALYLLCIKDNLTFASGDLLILCCGFCFAVQILAVDYFVRFVDGVLLSCSQFFFCGIFSLICALIWGTSTISGIIECIWPILYLGVFSCGVAYTLQIVSQKGSNPTVVTILFSLESVFAVIFAAIILNERMSVREYCGCILMFIAVIIAQIDFKSLFKLEHQS